MNKLKNILIITISLYLIGLISTIIILITTQSHNQFTNFFYPDLIYLLIKFNLI